MMHSTAGREHAVARAGFWLALVAFTLLGFLSSKGIILLVEVIALAAYDVIRHRRIPVLGYGLLIVGMALVAVLWFMAN